MNTPTPDTVTPGVDRMIAAEIRAAMGRETLSRRALAEKLDVDPMWVSRRLTGQTPFSVEDVVRICEALKIPPLPVLTLALT